MNEPTVRFRIALLVKEQGTRTGKKKVKNYAGNPEKVYYQYFGCLREFTKNNTSILPVFLPIFCVAIMK